MKILVIILLIFLANCIASAEEKHCTKTEAMEAEMSIDHLNNWEEVYSSYNRFKHCGDDGAVAEGYSDSVVRLLAFNWNQIEKLMQLSSDKDFFAFVIRHIDATTGKSEIQKIITNSNQHCPDSATVICLAIEEAARKALKELNGY
ncbi:MAG: hypothetical protein HZA00_05100 [Nitrospinae bacterium]|nr:hypothetical protein [Nitrospinota bacterium]